ncbi:LUD domain-containing protein [Nonomuraea sp. NPDC050663]|uniref:LUD domain-containing protein n=1 Tax=Nonomuraea sp. NPDC050663 TaxID=3364370 RepID=UPI0037BC60DF
MTTFAEPAGAEQLQRATQGLTDRGFAVQVVDTAEEARKLVADLVPRDRSVFTAVSETLRLAGINADLDESGDYRSIRADQGEKAASATPDYIVGSVHAVTEAGQVVVASASGSQLGPYAAGAGRVIWVVGSQKIVKDLDTGLRRTWEHTLKLESERIERLYGQPSFIAKLLIVEREHDPERVTVVLVREAIGF